MGAPQPQFIPEAFAISADLSRRNVIPEMTVSTQRASFDLGFPPLVMTPTLAGGLPMLGPDVNGILYMMSSHTVYQQSGQPYRYNVDVALAIAGYAAGTVLGSTDGTALWFNLTNNNSTDPDAGGAGWVPMYSYGITTMPGTAGGVVVATSAQASKSVIVISGALTSNLQFVLPTSLRRWLIVNSTTGAFTTTVKTAAGTGVVVAQGGFTAPVEVYGDGTNIYPTVAALTIPTDVAPTPNTYPIRSNNGYIYATYFNSNNPLENFTISSLFAEMAGDGFHRKITLANAALQLFASFGVTGVVDNRSVTLPGGLILKFGYVTSGVSSVPVVFNTAFPNNAFAAVCATNRTTTAGTATGFVSALSTVGATFIMDTRSGVGAGFGGWWIAVGN